MITARTVRVRLDLAYDGSGFSGWARQPGLRTVEEELATALGRVLRCAHPALVVAGRTDAGVHARGQVVHVDLDEETWQDLPGPARAGRAAPEAGEVLLRRLAGVLPADVVVRRAAAVPAAFDARFGALWRRYAYRVADGPRLRDPLRRSWVLATRHPLDVDAMDAAGRRLVGEHDWLPFCRPRQGATTVRTLRRFAWARDDDGLAVADVRADAFCHHMVRSLVGACLAVGEGRRDVAWPAAVLAAGVRDGAVRVAPARGLVLEEVAYPAQGALAAQVLRTRRRRDTGPAAAPRHRFATGLPRWQGRSMSVTPDSDSPVGDDVYQPDQGLETDTDANDYDAGNSLGGKTQDEVLDEGYSPPERPRELGRFGGTAQEQAEGESLDQRLSEEVLDPTMTVPDPLAEDPGPVRGDAETSTGDADDTATPLLDGSEADLDTDGELLDDQVGDVRAGRLVAPGGGIGPDTEGDEVAQDVGVDGGAAGAEEAAVHVVDEDDTPGLRAP